MKKKHPPIYYKIRSAVRFAFWGSLAAGTLIGAMRLTEDKRPECDVKLNFDFTWNSEDFASLNEGLTLDQCRQPDDVVLHMDGTWDWIQER